MRKNVLSLFIYLLIATCSLGQGVAVDFNDQIPSGNEETKEPPWAAPALEHIFQTRQKGKVVLGYGRNNQPVEAYFFPGTSTKKALVVAGVHGSEIAGVEVAKTILALLDAGETPYYNVVVVPCLFPANAENALQANDPAHGRRALQ